MSAALAVPPGDTARAARIHAPAVNEDQGALRAQAAQADGRHADRADGGAGALLGDDLRQVVENVLGAHQAGLLDVDRT